MSNIHCRWQQLLLWVNFFDREGTVVIVHCWVDLLKLWVLIPLNLMTRYTRCNIMWHVCGFIWVLRFTPRCNWHFVESGVNSLPKPSISHVILSVSRNWLLIQKLSVSVTKKILVSKQFNFWNALPCYMYVNVLFHFYLLCVNMRHIFKMFEFWPLNASVWHQN